jgi:hypothetical protein
MFVNVREGFLILRNQMVMALSPVHLASDLDRSEHIPAMVQACRLVACCHHLSECYCSVMSDSEYLYSYLFASFSSITDLCITY